MSVYNDLTNPFTIQTGVRQGCILSPMIFNVVIDWIMKSVEAPIFKVTRDLNIADLAYADDIVLLGENEEDAQRFLREISTAAARLGLIVSIPKTKAVYFNCTTPSISLNNSNIENVEVLSWLEN